MGTFEYYHCYGNPLYRVSIPKYDILQGCFMVCDWFSVWYLGSWNNHLSPVCRSSCWQITFKMSWYLNPREWIIYFLFINISTLIVTIAYRCFRCLLPHNYFYFQLSRSFEVDLSNLYFHSIDAIVNVSIFRHSNWSSKLDGFLDYKSKFLHAILLEAHSSSVMTIALEST